MITWNESRRGVAALIQIGMFAAVCLLLVMAGCDGGSTGGPSVSGPDPVVVAETPATPNPSSTHTATITPTPTPNGTPTLMPTSMPTPMPSATPTHSTDESATDDCNESYYRIGRFYTPGSPPLWAPISSIPSWREVDEAELRSELEGGGDVTATDLHGRTLLHWAAKCSDRTGVIELLLEHGADVNAGMTTSGETPLWVAIDSDNSLEGIEFLLDHGATFGGWTFVRSGLHEDPAVTTLLLDRGADIRARSEGNNTILHTALDIHGLDVLELLVERGADIHAKNDFGETPLHRAAFNREDPRVVELLLDMGADINVKARDGDTPLHGAASSNVEAVVKLLLDRGANVNARGDLGYTPLHSAAFWDADPAVIELLLDRGADINAVSDFGYTAINRAAAGVAGPAVVELLLERGAGQHINHNAE